MSGYLSGAHIWTLGEHGSVFLILDCNSLGLCDLVTALILFIHYLSFFLEQKFSALGGIESALSSTNYYSSGKSWKSPGLFSLVNTKFIDVNGKSYKYLKSEILLNRLVVLLNRMVVLFLIVIMFLCIVLWGSWIINCNFSARMVSAEKCNFLSFLFCRLLKFMDFMMNA